jgi:flagellar basal body-associated protein FliL
MQYTTKKKRLIYVLILVLIVIFAVAMARYLFYLLSFEKLTR